MSSARETHIFTKNHENCAQLSVIQALCLAQNSFLRFLKPCEAHKMLSEPQTGALSCGSIFIMMLPCAANSWRRCFFACVAPPGSMVHHQERPHKKNLAPQGACSALVTAQFCSQIVRFASAAHVRAQQRCSWCAAACSNHNETHRSKCTHEPLCIVAMAPPARAYMCRGAHAWLDTMGVVHHAHDARSSNPRSCDLHAWIS